MLRIVRIPRVVPCFFTRFWYSVIAPSIIILAGAYVIWARNSLEAPLSAKFALIVAVLIVGAGSLMRFTETKLPDIYKNLAVDIACALMIFHVAVCVLTL